MNTASAPTVSPTITTIEESDQLHILGETLRPLVTNDMGASVEVFDTSGPAETGPPPHRHAWEEIYVMLAGEMEVAVGGNPPIRVGVGGVVHVPSDTVHSYRILTDDTRFLTIFSKGQAARFFRDVASEVQMEPLDIPALATVAGRHGVSLEA